MQPLHFTPQDLVGANLRRAYRSAPPDVLPPDFEDLLQRLSERLDVRTDRTPHRNMQMPGVVGHDH